MSEPRTLARSPWSPGAIGLLVGFVSLAPLYIIWAVAAMVLSFYAGATFGGYGAAPEPASAWWYVPVLLAMAAAGLVLAGWISWLTATVVRRRRRRRGIA